MRAQLLALVASVVCTTSVLAADVSGKWTAEIVRCPRNQTCPSTEPAVLTLTLDEDRVSGTIAIGSGGNERIYPVRDGETEGWPHVKGRFWFDELGEPGTAWEGRVMCSYRIDFDAGPDVVEGYMRMAANELACPADEPEDHARFGQFYPPSATRVP